MAPSRVPLLYTLVACLMPECITSDRDPRTAGPDQAATVPVGGIVSIVVGAIVLVVVALIYAGVGDPLMNATQNLTNLFETADTGNATINSIMPTFGLLTAALIPLGLLGAIVVAVNRNL